MNDFLQNQSDNLFLWVPFIMAFGAGLYFNVPQEPNLVLCVIGAVICLVLSCVRVPILIRILSLFVFGFCYAGAFAHYINMPQIPHALRNIDITGVVSYIDYTDDKTRIYIQTDADKIVGNHDSAVVRVSLNRDITPPNVGDVISANVGLFRPNGADAPESFDYARWTYFNGLTATGYLTHYDIITPHYINTIATLRNKIHEISDSFLVDTLVLGYKNAVPEQDAKIWTATGVGHVWSISGFHIALVSGWLFAIFYFLVRLITPITRRVPARIPALICAWVGLVFYLFLSGCDVATLRAFIMTTLAFCAFIIGRNAISVRNICIAFLILFLVNPHYVMQPGFQLSFSAVFGLVWLWTDVKPKMPHNKILGMIYGAILTSVVATVFTAPFVIMHFYNLPLYGIFGNLVLLPVFSVAIMPLVIIGVMCAPFGWNWPTDFAEQIYNFCLGIGEFIAGLSGSTVVMPHIPNIAMVFIILGLMCVIFIRPIRVKINWILSISFTGIGILLVAINPRPVFYATADHELVAFVGENGNLEFSKSRASGHYFAFNTWRQINGEAPSDKNIRRKPVDGLWIYETENFTVAYIQKYVPLQNNIVRLCRDKDIDYIVSYFDIDAPQCNHKILRGGFVIYPSSVVQHIPLNRPWHNPHE